jgi:hypothetical protein
MRPRFLSVLSVLALGLLTAAGFLLAQTIGQRQRVTVLEQRVTSINRVIAGKRGIPGPRGPRGPAGKTVTRTVRFFTVRTVTVKGRVTTITETVAGPGHTTIITRTVTRPGRTATITRTVTTGPRTTTRSNTTTPKPCKPRPHKPCKPNS